MAKRRKKKKKNGSLLIFALLCISVGYVLNDMIRESYAKEEVIVDDVQEVKKKTISYDIDNVAISSHFIDVGQGDATFIELPNDETMLIDAGLRENGKKIVNYIKELGYNKITYLVATHPHADHIGGMREVVNNLDIDFVYMPKASNNTPTYINLLKAIEKKELKIKTAKAGVNIIDQDSYKIDIIAPNSDNYEELNNYSAVIKITYKNISYLYMGDAEKISEDEIKTDVKADVLKVGHHGSDTSSSIGFVKRVNPSYAIISVGSYNMYGHPRKNILNRYSIIGATVYRTDLNGTVIVSTNGDEISINTEK